MPRHPVVMAVVACAVGLVGAAAGEQPAATVVGKVAFTAARPDAQISTVSLSADGKHLAVVSRAETNDVLDVFDVGTGKTLPLPLDADEVAGSAGFSPDGNLVVVATARPGLRNTLHVFELPGMRRVYRFETLGWGVGPFAVSADGKFLLRPGRDAENSTFAWEWVELGSGKTVSRIVPDRQQLAQGDFHELVLPASNQYVLTRQDEWVLGWEVATGNETLRWRWTGNGCPAAMKAVPGTSHLRVVCEEGTVVTLDYTTGAEVSRLRLDLPRVEHGTRREMPFIRPWSLQNVAFSDDSKIILKGGPGRVLRWDATNGRGLPAVSLGGGPAAEGYTGSMAGKLLVANVAGQRSSDLAVVKLP